MLNSLSTLCLICWNIYLSSLMFALNIFGAWLNAHSDYEWWIKKKQSRLNFMYHSTYVVHCKPSALWRHGSINEQLILLKVKANISLSVASNHANANVLHTTAALPRVKNSPGKSPVSDWTMRCEEKSFHLPQTEPRSPARYQLPYWLSCPE
jgi:hypothetical protein